MPRYECVYVYTYMCVFMYVRRHFFHYYVYFVLY